VLLGKIMRNQSLQLVIKSNNALVGFDAQGVGAIRRDRFMSANAWINITRRISCQRFATACTRVNLPVFCQSI